MLACIVMYCHHCRYRISSCPASLLSSCWLRLDERRRIAHIAVHLVSKALNRLRFETVISTHDQRILLRCEIFIRVNNTMLEFLQGKART